MSILHEILIWSEGLPDWQSNAIGLLFEKQNLDSEDIEDLYALLKVEQGIPDPKGRIANRLNADLISIPIDSGTHVGLLGIKNLVNVNAIANNETLSFGAKGLTVIYGDNGSGKSGYSRVLKRACRARDQSEPILPNANQPPQTEKTEATFVIEVNDEVREEKWVDGTPAHEDLSTIAIFDQRCARAYVDDEDDFSYVPYGLDIFKGLAWVNNQLKNRVEEELRQCIVKTSQFDDFHGATEVGHLVENLSCDTNPKYVEVLTDIKPEDIQQHDLLERSLNNNNPLEKIEQLRRSSQRITRIANKIKENFGIIDDSELERFLELDKSFLSAKVAAEIAVEKFNTSGHLLDGTGSESWRELFEAARKFSEVTYPGKFFPHVEDGAKCLLCQQSLKDGASRLRQFEEFIQQDTEQTLRGRKTDLDEAKEGFLECNLSLGLDNETLSEIATYDKTLAQDCQTCEKEFAVRFENISSAFTTHEWSDIPKISVNPLVNLESLVNDLSSEAKILMEASQAVERVTLKKQFDELDARIRFSPYKEAILTVIEKKRKKIILENCLAAVKTKAISLKAKEVAKEVITHDLSDALTREFKKMRVADLNVELKSRSDKGKPLYKLVIQLQNAENPGNILSEGEQRAIAIASFLAEVNLSGGTCGIIFDDPVSSLDHRRRDLVAKRFAIEATKRQVIVFTHDIYFLCVLIEEAEEAGVPVETRSLIRKSHGFGVPIKGNPFEGMNTAARVKFLHGQQKEIAKIHMACDELECRRRIKEAYSDLRSAWERAVEEVLFRQVVLRFRRGVETNRLIEVLVEDDDYAKIKQGMSKCSKVTTSHDTALAIGNNVPDPEELLVDIDALETWRLSVVKRGESVKKRRK